MNNVQSPPDNPSILVHSALMRYKWARLWYFCRDRDTDGRGWVVLSWSEIQTQLSCAHSTLYDWLQTGRRAGAFRSYRREGDRLTIYLGSLFKVCQKLGLESWGTTATVLPDDLWCDGRLIATTVAIQGLQQQSHYAARRSLKDKTYKIPTADEVVSEAMLSSLQPAWGAIDIPYAIAAERGKLFVSRGYIAHGVNQETIAADLGIAPRTVRHHLKLTGVEKVQQVKSCAGYGEIVQAMEYDAPSWLTNGLEIERHGDHWRLFERNGWDSSTRKEGHKITPQNFFFYKGKWWRYLPNLYYIRHELKSTRYLRRNYKKLISKKARSPSSKDKNSLSKFQPRLAKRGDKQN